MKGCGEILEVTNQTIFYKEQISKIFDILEDNLKDLNNDNSNSITLSARLVFDDFPVTFLHFNGGFGKEPPTNYPKNLSFYPITSDTLETWEEIFMETLDTYQRVTK